MKKKSNKRTIFESFAELFQKRPFLRILALPLCALVLALTLMPTPAMAGFGDVREADWFYPYVTRLVEQGVTTGMSESRYAPGETVNAAQTAAFAARYLGLDEDARILGEAAKAKGVTGSGLWYCGYVQLALRGGYLKGDRYGMVVGSDGFAAISADAAALLESPVTRLEAFEMIARSLELDSSAVRSRVIPSEAGGGLGHELICGGGYDGASLALYKDDIADISAIPLDKLEWIQKLMYNGIVGGDEKGRINPYNNITRAEMAKVIAAVSNFDLRSRKEYRQLPEGTAVSAEDFVVSPRTGATVLSPARAEAILREQAASLTAVKATYGYMLEYGLKNIAPEGYVCQVMPFIQSGARYVEFGTRFSAGAVGSSWMPLKRSVNPTLNNTQVVFLLRNAAQGGRIEGTLTAMIDTSLNITYSFSW